jgi:hypothetical protein
VRRLSGGGAVYHDLGNLNFSFLTKDDGDSFRNFKKFTQPIVDALKEMGVDAELSGRNDILAGGRKISGNYDRNIFAKIFEMNWTAGARYGIPTYWRSVKKQFEKIIRDVRPDMVHAHNIFSAKLVSEFGNLMCMTITNIGQSHPRYQMKLSIKTQKRTDYENYN